jgi:hypothetical protein
LEIGNQENYMEEEEKKEGEGEGEMSGWSELFLAYYATRELIALFTDT